MSKLGYIAIGLVVSLPFLLPLLLWLFGPLTDKWGWTRSRGKGRAMMQVSLEGYNLAVHPEWQAAKEYQKYCHDEEDHTGRKKRPHFPGVECGNLRVRPLQDGPGDIISLSVWLGQGPDETEAFVKQIPETQVLCMVEVDGRPASYLEFALLGPDRGFESSQRVYAIDRCLGPSGADPDVHRLLAAYLVEFEQASQVLAGDPLAPVQPGVTGFCLLHTGAGA